MSQEALAQDSLPCPHPCQGVFYGSFEVAKPPPHCYTAKSKSAPEDDQSNLEASGGVHVTGIRQNMETQRIRAVIALGAFLCLVHVPEEEGGQVSVR